MATDGPSPSRILAAAASVSAGIGLVALLAGPNEPSPVVIQVEPAPVVMATSPTAPPRPPATADPGLVPPVEAATPAPAVPQTAVPQTTVPPTTVAPARVVTTTEGS